MKPLLRKIFFWDAPLGQFRATPTSFSNINIEMLPLLGPQ